MSNWLSRAFARFTGRQPQQGEAANANRKPVTTTVRRKSSGGPSYGGRSSSSSDSYIHTTSWSSWDSGSSYGDSGSCGGGDGGGCGGGD